MKNANWDSYQLFLQVARLGGLTGASAASGLSPATVGRRMLDLEQEIGRALFSRSQTGYRLTGDGQALLDHLQEMEAAARKVEAWRQSGEGGTTVRIAAGTWVAWLLTENFAAIRMPGDAFAISLTIGEARASLAYRESDIGIRAFEPEEANLAARRLGEVAYAVYIRRNAAETDERWIAVAEEEAISAYLRWPHAHAANDIVATVNRPRSLPDLVRAGAGKTVLPCFVGDLDPQLQRLGGELPELRHAQWIVMNAEDRHRPEIRTVADRMIKLIRSYADLFAGKRPSRG
ncbi:DNA-binding transcriptional LysR family regulator [Rhizobium leguminosarum]|uniref:DNA-binding transcriptional LysR family regulator n=1 Tax=Rhizobium leguminosarum TaxID=384 RepID=A0AAE2MG43_RHILE|nr:MULTISPECIES: LysR family transcriptional regulator [Rhizobium]MBB4288510.1 DNA-binding transcriptional LysR family regulator [Rhizobium leguminosarum]MBB4295397.1 DNA-binding transcriptional LysR family regulator [Rhizobium leguminosarum]MBB4306790.1 DNA-binding transcriptional LysR family regulator [Rhizobium leguminosarum]MBB4417628.1 DNA-binding transcriptional LysR family regulator [Rhizobium leguminosarum]MBB4432473.1 DNA-binding transcriptional LysR family regulator [Rhizobium espera